jgi:hypothetical protein
MFDLANASFAACRLRRESFTSAGLQSFKFEGCRAGVGWNQVYSSSICLPHTCRSIKRLQYQLKA